MKRILLSLLFCLPFILNAQINDCAGAEVVCSDDNIFINPQGPGINDFADPDNNEGCIVALESNTAWFYFEIDEGAPSGLELGFTIDPSGGLGEDYDWALFGPNVTCDSLGDPYRCSSSSAACDFCPLTGMGMGTTDLTEGPGTGDGFVSTMFVEPGQGYFLMIDNWAGTNNPFELTWTGDAAPWLECDAEPPCNLQIEAGPSVTACAGEGDIQLMATSSGGNGMEIYEWTGTGAQYLNDVSILDPVFTPPVGITGTFTLILTGILEDCDPVDELTITINPIPNVTIDDPGVFCANDEAFQLTGSPAGGDWSALAPDGLFNPEDVGPGVHTVTYTYSQPITNCENTASIDITVFEAPEVEIAPDPASFCEEDLFVIITASGSGGSPGYSYFWDTPIGTFDGDLVTATTFGDYYVTITDDNNCTGTTSIYVEEYPTPVVTIDDPGVICTSQELLTMTGSPADGTWSGDGITNQGLVFPDDLGPGTYTFTYEYTDPLGCTGMDMIDVTISEAPVATASNDGPYCEGNGINLFGESDVDGVTYNWTGPNGYTSSDQNPTDATEEGIYTLVLTLGDCSSAPAETEVEIATGLTPDADAQNDGPYCSGQTIQLLGSTTSQGNQIVYQWTGPNNFSSDEQNPSGNLEAGIYSLIVIADNCASEASTTEVIITEGPDAMAGNTGPYCAGDMVQLNGSSTTQGNLVYQWTGPNNYSSDEQNPSGMLEAGTYELVVNNDGCLSTIASTLVEINVLPAPSIDGNLSTCEGGSETLEVVEMFDSYEWSTSSDQSSITVDATGSYSVTVYDNIGCSGEATVNFTINDNPEVSISGSSSYCIGGSTTLDAGAGFADYLWSDNSNLQTISINTPGMVGVTVTDANGCTGETSVDITESTSLNPIISGATSFCPGGSTTLDAGPGFDMYTWSSSEDTQTITTSTPQLYTVTVSDLSGCTGTAEVNVTENPTPAVDITPSGIFCEGETINLAASSGYESYEWSTSSLNENIMVDQNGNYSVTVTDVNDCTNEASFDVNLAANPQPMITGDPDFCIGSSTVIDAGAGFVSYEWSTGGSDQTLELNSSGTVSVEVIDANGCRGTDDFEVFELPGPTATIDGMLEFCDGESTTLTGPAGLSNYNWNGTDGNSNITITSAGSVVLIVTDSDGCTDTETVSVSVNPNPTPSLSVDGILCDGNSVNITLDQAYSQYEWSDGSDLASLAVNSSNTYSVTVTDSNGCIGEASIDVDENSSFEPTIDGTLEFCEGDNTILTAEAGFEIYEWSNGEMTQSITVSQAGDYSVEVTDINGCKGSASVTVINPSAINPDLGPDFEVGIGQGVNLEVQLDIDLSNVASIEWSPESIINCLDPDCRTVSVDPDIINNITVTVTDIFGCVETDQIQVRVDSEKDIYIPNAFSPNRDGTNDVFSVFGNPTVVTNVGSMKIYDRWGELVYFGQNLSLGEDGWDGNFDNAEVKPGVYVYVVVVDYFDGTSEVLSGTVTVVK